MKTLALGLVPPLLVLGLFFSAEGPVAWPDEEANDELTFDIGEGTFQLTAPETWIRKEPKVKIIDHEFEVPPAEGDELAGRVTVMGAGGSVEENIDRWYRQFTQPDGRDTKDVAKPVEELEIAGQEVHLVDVTGTYLDKPPFAGGKGVRRENYRMLAAIIVTQEAGNYFVKLYGPNQTVTDQEEGFKKMIEGLRKK